MTIEYEKVKQDFFSGRIKGCRSYFENNHQYVEAAYCCIILDNLDRAEELLAKVKDIDIRANWGLVLIQMLKGDIKYFPTYFEIRNFLEIDLNILILYCKSDYVEKVIKYADFMIGNSSAGIRETGVYAIPGIDLGTRQQGRYSKNNKNLQHVSEDKEGFGGEEPAVQAG